MPDKTTIHMATNKYTKNMAKFKYLEMAVRNKSCIHKEMMRLGCPRTACWGKQHNDKMYDFLCSKNIWINN
jgi:hypothetical protein